MQQESRVKMHELAARREDDAAMRAADEESARSHAELATLHRLEAAKIRSVKDALTIAFGD